MTQTLKPLPALTTPCHGTTFFVITRPTGGYLSSDEPDEILCSAEGCTNSWNADGTVAYEDEREWTHDYSQNVR